MTPIRRLTFAYLGLLAALLAVLALLGCIPPWRG